MILNIGLPGFKDWKKIEREPPRTLANLTFLVEGEEGNRKFTLEGTDNPIYEHNLGLVDDRALEIIAMAMAQSKGQNMPCMDRILGYIELENPFEFKKGIKTEYRELLGRALYAHSMKLHPNVEWDEVPYDFEGYIRFTFARSASKCAINETRFMNLLIEGSSLKIETFDFRKMILKDGVMRTTVELKMREI